MNAERFTAIIGGGYVLAFTIAAALQVDSLVPTLAVFFWPLGLLVPGLLCALPQVFQPWSDEYRLARRIRQARREQRLIELRKEAEKEEAAASALLDRYLEIG